ncbi:MAG: MBL fold metallo-hydrolase [Actinobacteria bacterium]|jgi:glyoxylase-like metal-dependent hydrolase (beta-lactamase superfamily II)|nr:MBL fold metallo-hydrolase [Actinomycetota bacterium]
MFIRQLPLWIAQTNCWIISRSKSESECILVDVPPEPAVLSQILNINHLRPVALLATHGHVDHIGGMAEISRFQGEPPEPGSIPVSIHTKDQHMLLDPIGTSGLLAEELMKMQLDLTPPEQITGLSDGDVIKGLEMTFRAIHTPGHTQGSTCFLLKDDQSSESMLFSGDHLFKGSIGRTDLPGGSFEALIESMRQKILPLDDQLPVLPGHGEATTIGHEKTTNPFLQNL